MAFDDSYDSPADNFDPDAVEGAVGIEDPEEPAAAEEPADPLADLDGDTRALVDRYVAGREEQQRAAWREQGLDVNRDGRLLVADAQKVASWAGVAPPRASPPVVQPPNAATPAESDPDPQPDFDPLSATPEDYRRLARWEARQEMRQEMRPLLEENRRLANLMQQRSASEAVQGVRQTVEQRLPGLAPMLEHPDFAAAYEREVANAAPEYLANPVFVAAVAASVCAQLDPGRMPAAPARSRDDAGRFAAGQHAEGIARNMAQRQTIGGTPPARGGGGSRYQPDPEAERGARIFGHIQSKLPPDLANRLPASADAWEDAAALNFDDYQARRKARAAATPSRRR